MITLIYLIILLYSGYLATYYLIQISQNPMTKLYLLSLHYRGEIKHERLRNSPKV